MAEYGKMVFKWCDENDQNSLKNNAESLVPWFQQALQVVWTVLMSNVNDKYILIVNLGVFIS